MATLRRMISGARILAAISALVLSVQLLAQDELVTTTTPNASPDPNVSVDHRRVNTISLESQVKGNQEQPNVLNIVPWKFADDQSRIDSSIESDIGRLFQHLDRAEFARQQQIHKHFSELADE